jgi:hypothetical protein
MEGSAKGPEEERAPVILTKRRESGNDRAGLRRITKGNWPLNTTVNGS